MLAISPVSLPSYCLDPPVGDTVSDTLSVWQSLPVLYSISYIRHEDFLRPPSFVLLRNAQGTPPDF